MISAPMMNAAAAALVLDDDGPAFGLLEIGGDQASHGVGRATGPEPDGHSDRPGRLPFGLNRGRGKDRGGHKNSGSSWFEFYDMSSWRNYERLRRCPPL
jgi:hypothetical protein